MQLASANCQRYELENVEIFQSSWFAEIPPQRFDLIVSNPPYIEDGDAHFTQGDVRFEPASALVSGSDGLDDLRLLIAESVNYLPIRGWLMVEHGYQQGPAVASLFRQAGFSAVETRADLNGLERITLGCLLRACDLAWTESASKFYCARQYSSDSSGQSRAKCTDNHPRPEPVNTQRLAPEIR